MKIKDTEILENVSLKNYNTYKIESFAKYLIKVKNVKALKETLKHLKKNKIKYFILGSGSNIVLDDYFDGAIIKLNGLDYISLNDNIITVGAGCLLPKLSRFSIDNNLTGLEWAINIPGTVGGSINGNAGAYNKDIFDNLIEIRVLDKNFAEKNIKKEEIDYKYRCTDLKKRGYIVIDAKFKLESGNKEEALNLINDRCERRKNTQPLEYPSAGSVFRNPANDFAGRLIEEAGLKGIQIGGAKISEKHANFIVNVGNATSKDIKNLIKLIKDEVKSKFNIDLIVEQEIVDWCEKNDAKESKEKT